MIFRSRKRRDTEPAGADGASAALSDASGDVLLTEIEALSRANRERRDPDNERRLLTLRNRAALALAPEVPDDPRYATAANVGSNGSGLPEVAPGELTAERLRGGILQGGCLLVRGLVGPDEVAELKDEIDRAFEARDARDGADGYFEEFVPEHGEVIRWTEDEGSLWTADSPRLTFDVCETLQRAGLREVIDGYLGEPAALTVEKGTLRRVRPDANRGFASSTWHQDGAFLGDVRSLNVWLSLSRCGDVAPGMDVVPRRLDHIVPAGTEGAYFDWSVSPAVAEKSAGEAGIVRPIFEPGDALFFDHLFLHGTAAEPDMPESRYAIETWFFGLSGLPEHYAPLTF